MRDLNHQLKELCRRNRDGSHATQRDRERILSLIADQLHALGFRGMSSGSLKPKHVEALLGHWQREDLSVGTIKNRLAALRWWAQKVDRQNVIARSNAHYGIPERRFVADGSKARTVEETDLDKVRDPHVRMSLELQRAFGLRREEAIKFSPSYADQGDHLLLKASWTKGGKARSVPVRTAEQREVLDRAHRARRPRLADPSRAQLPPATTRLRAPHRQRRTLQAPRSATSVCAGPLRGADRVEGPGRGRSFGQGPQRRAAGVGPGGAADHQPGAGS